ncbi:LysR substrate-binding domain-containing protein [Paludibacterium paludis]|uniref:LysR family transcriptional regulator n=1 Tax=Paludibacterium paludis TaxID=1225769 RepID=A0A918P6K2_9NEIS|nr:LysR substrate-binding domain-containing protein [Paludibacterium paludis]GGY25951.1 LysR family transcriptional regulator [Paludibacterium paludis]
MNITIRQLRAFLAVAQEGSIANASEKLFLTRPAVSQTLQELERQFDKKLFHRVSNRLILNAEGKRLLPYIDELIQRINQIENFFTDDSDNYRKLKIGATKSIGNYLLPKLLQQNHAKNGVGFPTVFVGSTADICAKLQTTELDMALIECAAYDNFLNKLPWISDEMIVIAPVASRIAMDEPLTVSDLEREPWVVREMGSGSRELFESAIGSRLKHKRVALEVNATEAIISAVTHGAGLAFVSRIAAEDAIAHGLVRRLPMKDEYSRRFCIVTHCEKFIGPDLQALIDFLVDYAAATELPKTS